MWLLWYMIWCDMCMMWMIMSGSMKTLWYDICVTWMIWYIDMQNDELAWNITPIHAWKIWEKIWKMIWYEEDASGIVLNDNENEKMLGPHALLYTYSTRDTPTPSW